MIYAVDFDRDDDAKDRWRECRECGCPIGDTDELCRSLTCHLYGKRALANARSASTCAFKVGDRVERYLIDQPDAEPQAGYVLAVENGRIYVVGATFGMWWDIGHHTIGIREVT